MATVKSKGRSAEDFQKEHDMSYIVPQRIRAGLAELGDTWEYEPDFMKRIGCNASMVSPHRAAFDEFTVDIKPRAGRSHSKRAWAGTKKLATSLREMVNR